MSMLCAARSSRHACSLRIPWRVYLAMMRPNGAQRCVVEAADVHFGPGHCQEIEGVEGVTAGASQMLQRVVVYYQLRTVLLRAEILS